MEGGGNAMKRASELLADVDAALLETRSSSGEGTRCPSEEGHPGTPLTPFLGLEDCLWAVTLQYFQAVRQLHTQFLRKPDAQKQGTQPAGEVNQSPPAQKFHSPHPTPTTAIGRAGQKGCGTAYQQCLLLMGLKEAFVNSINLN